MTMTADPALATYRYDGQDISKWQGDRLIASALYSEWDGRWAIYADGEHRRRMTVGSWQQALRSLWTLA